MRWSSLLVPLSLVSLAACADPAEPGADETSATPRTERTVDAAQVKAVESSLRDYLLASDAGDCAAVKRVILVPRLVECSDVRTGAGQWSSGGNVLAKVPMATEITDESAMVTVTWKSGAEDIWDLQYADGRWRVLNADLGDDA